MPAARPPKKQDGLTADHAISRAALPMPDQPSWARAVGWRRTHWAHRSQGISGRATAKRSNSAAAYLRPGPRGPDPKPPGASVAVHSRGRRWRRGHRSPVASLGEVPRFPTDLRSANNDKACWRGLRLAESPSGAASCSASWLGRKNAHQAKPCRPPGRSDAGEAWDIHRMRPEGMAPGPRRQGSNRLPK